VPRYRFAGVNGELEVLDEIANQFLAMRRHLISQEKNCSTFQRVGIGTKISPFGSGGESPLISILIVSLPKEATCD